MQQLSKPSLQKRAKPKARAFVHVWRLKDGFAWFVAGDDVGGIQAGKALRCDHLLKPQATLHKWSQRGPD